MRGRIVRGFSFDYPGDLLLNIQLLQRRENNVSLPLRLVNKKGASCGRCFKNNGPQLILVGLIIRGSQVVLTGYEADAISAILVPVEMG